MKSIGAILADLPVARIKPATLQLLMRHKSIETTMKYYVCQDSDDVADELWASDEATQSNGKQADAPKVTV